jgi:kinesin family member 5
LSADNCGLIPRIVRNIFEELDRKSDQSASDSLTFTLKVSYVEIYMERVKDLLDPAKQNLRIRETKGKGVWIQDVTTMYVSTEEEIYQLLELGATNRAIASTEMNSESSRSHSVFILHVGQTDPEKGINRQSKLFLVDLAGSEKVDLLSRRFYRCETESYSEHNSNRSMS